MLKTLLCLTVLLSVSISSFAQDGLVVNTTTRDGRIKRTTATIKIRQGIAMNGTIKLSRVGDVYGLDLDVMEYDVFVAHKNEALLLCYHNDDIYEVPISASIVSSMCDRFLFRQCMQVHFELLPYEVEAMTKAPLSSIYITGDDGFILVLNEKQAAQLQEYAQLLYYD